eukprot:9343269-Pyramimonas_sp.AAC.1
MMLQPALVFTTRKNFEHQESIGTGRFSRVGPWEAILVRHLASVSDSHCFGCSKLLFGFSPYVRWKQHNARGTFAAMSTPSCAAAHRI